MGIYIKNIKKPWRCDECMFTDNLDECIFLKTDADIDGLNIDCPIVEIADRKDEPKRGEWVEMYRDGFGNMICMCSKCNFHASRSCYCPNCGARMKGADDE